MVQRLVYRSRHSYAVKTPGGKEREPCRKAISPWRRVKIRPPVYKSPYRFLRNQRNVNRAYGGVLAGSEVKERIIRAFLVEEKKTLKKVFKLQKAKEKVAPKA